MLRYPHGRPRGGPACSGFTPTTPARTPRTGAPGTGAPGTGAPWGTRTPGTRTPGTRRAEAPDGGSRPGPVRGAGEGFAGTGGRGRLRRVPHPRGGVARSAECELLRRASVAVPDPQPCAVGGRAVR
ncbi:hypothetical protein CAC01_04925 [Streptomyces sp. CLI2509]|nr:hypothetical protein CAC01_04925 [Streptomyces sp. CLI2509]